MVLIAQRAAGAFGVSAYFAEKVDKAKRQKLAEHAHSFVKSGGVGDGPLTICPRDSSASILPFHWQIEFPEVFSRERPGFDVFIGNPPFAGKNVIFAASGETYVYYLVDAYPGAHGSSDLVAYFFRRSFELLREGGSLGLVATNTIAQGDTRTTGLAWICNHGGRIYEAQRRYRWPGAAAVIVSIVHVQKNAVPRAVRLDGRSVGFISAFLFHGGGNDNPASLAANKGISFIGSYILGSGFIFDAEGLGAGSLDEMHALFDRDPRNRERVFPLQGGEQLNSDPSQRPKRWVINFADMDEAEAQAWPGLMARVRAKVKPERDKLGDNGDARRRRTYWWRWGQYSHALFAAMRGVERVLVNSQVSQHLTFAFQPSDYVFSHTLNVMVVQTYSGFCAVQCRVHEVWARFLGSSFKDDARYTPSDCFETFPFPPDWQQNPALEAAGNTYYEYRASLMADEAVRADLKGGLPPEGLTATYNRFHDPDETLPGILRLRELHAAMDRAVLDAYGWIDLKPTCEFLLDYEEEEDEEMTGGRARTKKKPWRYRWPDEVRDEVLARLLALNAERAAEERRLGAEAGLAAAKGKKGEGAVGAAEKKPAKGRGKKKGGDGQGDLFG